MTDDLLDDEAPLIPQGFTRMNWFRGFGNQIGPLYEKIGPGANYTRAFLVGEHHTNGMKNCHGGMLMAFADVAFGHAVSMRAADEYWVTIRLVTDFIAAAKVGDWVEGNAQIAGVEDDVYTVKGRLWCGDRIIMTGTGIFKTVGKRPPRK